MELFRTDRLTILDGGMGTLLQGMGLRGGEKPERWNLDHPERVRAAHAAYLEAGAEIIAANTFGATERRLGADAGALMEAGVRVALAAARDAGRGRVAVDMGSLGALIAPYGDLPFEEAVAQFRRALGRGLLAGAELILIETMTDLTEMKACVLGAREAMADAGVTVPLLCSFSFDVNGRLLTGADIEGAVATVAALRADAVGMNCGHEPSALYENGRRLCACSPLPVFVCPNASLPVVKDGQTTFPTDPERFAADMLPFAAMGASGLGGCCGTTPEHIRLLAGKARGLAPAPRAPVTGMTVCGRGAAVHIGGRPALIGERLNPTGKPRMKQALREGDFDYLRAEAVAQAEAGAHALDVNVGLPGVDEPALLARAVEAAQAACDLPVVIDTADAAALESALRRCAGRPVVNSVSGKQASLDAVLPLAARYGGAAVALTLDENGIPETAEGRLAIARRILAAAEQHGLTKNDLLFDALTMTVGTDPNAARVTLATVRGLKELGLLTVLGASNVSFGLPQRPLVNAAFLAMATAAGLDAAIMNPGDALCRAALDAAAALAGREGGVDAYVRRYAGAPKLGLAEVEEGAGATGADTSPAPAADPILSHPLAAAVLRGLAADAAREADRLLDAGEAPLAVMEARLMPALNEAGARYEAGKTFLPQLLQSAGAAQAAFDRVRARMPEQSAAGARKVVLATVQGDVHDIGKNIVKVLLQNYGYTVIDLGRDVPPEAVVKAARREQAPLVGLSALMTTTVPAMQATIALLARELPGVRTVVGGAVLTADYAKQIGADFYARDAMATVRVADAVFMNKD